MNKNFNNRSGTAGPRGVTHVKSFKKGGEFQNRPGRNFPNRGGPNRQLSGETEDGKSKDFKSFNRGKDFSDRGARSFPNKGGKQLPGEQKKVKAKDFTSYKSTTNKDEEGKTDWNELKTQMKTLREERKKNKKQTFYDTYKEAKKLWEKLRLHSCKPQEKEELCNKIMTLIKGNVKMIVKSHDMARIVQWLLKLGSDSIREQIFTEMSAELVAMSKNKYTKHTVKSLLQHCPPSMKKCVIQKCSGNIYSMTCNKVSAPLVEEMFKAAGPAERASMIKEFYGGIASDINLESVPINDEVTAALLTKSTKFLNTLIEKGHCLQMNLVHSVLYDYLQKCDSNSKAELLSNLKSHFRVLITSKDGVKLFSMILFESTAKEKKQIVKEFKTDIKEIAVGEHSSMALLLLIDSVDDTVLIKKALIPGIIENIETVVLDEHGRKVIIYLMVHRDSKYFHPKDIELLSQLDSSPNVKKDSTQKIHEIQESLLITLSEKITANPNFWFNGSSIAMVTLSIVKTLKGEHRTAALTSIADYIIDIKSAITEGEKSIPVIEHPGIHMVLKKIIANDKEIEDESETFSNILVSKLDHQIIDKWVETNRGCFTLVALLETKLSATVKKLEKKLTKISLNLDTQTSKGSTVLKKLITKA